MGRPLNRSARTTLLAALLASGFAPSGSSASALSSSPSAPSLVTSDTRQQAGAARPSQPASAKPPIENDLDAFMAKVLERRAETWRRLEEYILDEQEKFELLGPGDTRILGQQRNYNWYVRDGYLIRSPVKFNGVTLGDAERRKYENDWLNDEKQREQRQTQRRLDRAKAKEREAAGGAPVPVGPFDTGAPVQAGIDDILRDGGIEPRFISEAYFLQFKFEPGNYYLVGRERLDNHDVVKIEYYPRKRMFEDLDDEDGGGKKGREGNPKGEKDEKGAGNATRDRSDGGKATGSGGKDDKDGKKSDRAREMQDDFERKFNKVSLVTLWVDPAEHQIVKYIFDLPDFGFLPGRWAVRVDDAKAAMTMGQPIDGVWLPKDLSVEGGFTLANGGYRFRYGRAFFDYKLGEVRAKIRGYDTRER